MRKLSSSAVTPLLALVFRAQSRGFAVNCLDFSTDNTKLVSCSDKTVCVWSLENIQTPTEITRLTGHTDRVWSAKFAPDGTKIASGSDDRTVRIWSVALGKVLLTLRGHDRGVNCVSWSPDSRLVASAGDDRTVRVWDVVKGTQDMLPLLGHANRVNCVEWSKSNADLLVSGSWDKTIIVWSLAERVATVRHTLVGHAEGVRSVSLSADDKLVASASYDNKVCLWSVASGELVRLIEGHLGGVRSVAMSRDGQFIVSGSGDTTVRVWEVDEQVRSRNACAHNKIHSQMYISSSCIFQVHSQMYISSA